jgi:spore germination protein YaaH
LSIGQVITIPAGGVATVALAPTTPKPAPTPTYPATPSKSTPTPASTSTTSPGPAPQSNPRGVLSYRVHSSDTLESIASTFGTTPEKIRELNRKPTGSKVVPDEEILVPAMGAVSL